MKERLINKISNGPGPTMVFFGGIHGNERAGVLALEELFIKLDKKHISGTVIGLFGNLTALRENKRFIDHDLNRIWTEEQLEQLETNEDLSADQREQKQLYYAIKEILKNESEPFYFIDLHTTSSPTPPFITINDALINRAFSRKTELPIVLGIEEYLQGPLLSYINSLGYVSLGFEAGQHKAPESVENCYNFCLKALLIADILKEKFFPSNRDLKTGLKGFYEVIDVFKVTELDSFEMISGFVSFDHINKGEKLALYNNLWIHSQYTARIFMPLYQNQGEEGFFVITKVNPIFLGLSRILRRMKADRILPFLPGIKWINRSKGILQADLRITKYFSKQFFHLLGFRNRLINENTIILYNRERVARTSDYKNTSWH